MDWRDELSRMIRKARRERITALVLASLALTVSLASAVLR